MKLTMMLRNPVAWTSAFLTLVSPAVAFSNDMDEAYETFCKIMESDSTEALKQVGSLADKLGNKDGKIDYAEYEKTLKLLMSGNCWGKYMDEKGNNNGIVEPAEMAAFGKERAKKSGFMTVYKEYLGVRGK